MKKQLFCLIALMSIVSLSARQDSFDDELFDSESHLMDLEDLWFEEFIETDVNNEALNAAAVALAHSQDDNFHVRSVPFIHQSMAAGSPQNQRLVRERRAAEMAQRNQATLEAYGVQRTPRPSSAIDFNQNNHQ